MFGRGNKPQPNILSSTSGPKGRKTTVHGKQTRNDKGGDNKGGKKGGK